MLIAEELLLLATDGASGRTTMPKICLDAVLGGAILTELAMHEHIAVQGEGRATRVALTTAPAPENTILTTALRQLADASRPPTPHEAIRIVGRGLCERVHADLESSGILRREHAKVLGVFPSTRWPSSDAAPALAARTELRAVILGGKEPSLRAAAMITLLDTVNMLKTVVDRSELAAAGRRARAIEDENWAPDAVHHAIRATQAAVAAATVDASSDGGGAAS